MSLLDLSRWQFLYWRTGRALYLQMFRFWRRIFAVGFAIGVTVFFVEAGFIGVLLYGDGRVRKGTMSLSSVMVSVGTVLSSTWIIAANSWMRTPAGFKVVHGQFEPTDWMRVIFNPSFIWRRPHMLAAVLISASFFGAGISAWYLVKGRAKGFARRSIHHTRPTVSVRNFPAAPLLFARCGYLRLARSGTGEAHP
ncbi:cytochrome ubiquinol oxidase subunit I [Streptomyces phaeochromogenes]